ncbi:MAG TPA: class I tRNA ligase family protein, partial [Thermoanaerobaculia bacterium]|nr:class I tRNA ligase family protein [Thermoanaerobaculia bacterium]
PERWILSRLSATAAEVNAQLEILRFDEACNRLYHFFWGDLCDWYIELAKPALAGAAPRPRTGEVLLTVLDRSLRLLHPVMPFLTEEVWLRLPGRQAIHPETITLAPYPAAEPAWEAAEVECHMAALIEVVTRVRGLRADLEVPPGERVGLALGAADPALAGFLDAQSALIADLCRAELLAAGAVTAGAARDLVAGVELAIAVPQRALGPEDRQRLEKELDKIDGEIAGAESRLADERFLAKAPPAVVAGNRSRLAELRERRQRIVATLGGGVEVEA